jgi:glutamate--cysteine ligase
MSGERPTRALLRGGVQYVEMRSLDVSAFDPVGVNQHKLRFLEAFAVYCVLCASPSIEPSEQADLDGNHARVAREGRKPGLELRRDGRDVALRDWALEIVDAMRGVCELLDAGDPQRPYTTALDAQAAKVHDVSLTPAARALLEMRTTGESFFGFALRMSQSHKAYFLELYSPNESRQDEFTQEAEASLAQQSRIEATDTLSFDAYLERYFAG